MKKLVTLLLTLCLAIIPTISLTGCSFFDEAVDLSLIKEENRLLKEENAALKQELADLKFNVTFPDGVIREDIILNSVNRSVPTDQEGDAIQVTDSAFVVINGGKFDGGQTPLGGAGNTALWVNSADAKVLITGGEFKIGGLAEGDVGHIDLIYVTQGVVEITGGYFEGADDTVWLLNCKDAFYKDGTASIIVKGGTFLNFNPSDCISEGEHTNFVAEGYTVECEVFNYGTADEYALYTVVEVVDNQ